MLQQNASTAPIVPALPQTPSWLPSSLNTLQDMFQGMYSSACVAPLSLISFCSACIPLKPWCHLFIPCPNLHTSLHATPSWQKFLHEPTLSALVCTACLHAFPSITHLSERSLGAFLLLWEVALTTHAVTSTAQSPALGHISALFYIYALPISLGAAWEHSFHFSFVCKVLGTSLMLAANKKSKDTHL